MKRRKRRDRRERKDAFWKWRRFGFSKIVTLPVTGYDLSQEGSRFSVPPRRNAATTSIALLALQFPAFSALPAFAAL
jgi:hypothetical protein